MNHGFNDGSLSESIQNMRRWRQQRFGLSSPRMFIQRLRLSWSLFLKNRVRMALLLLAYFAIETVGNGVLLLLHKFLKKESRENDSNTLVILTASWPVKVLRAFLNLCVTHVIASALKRRSGEILLDDLFSIKHHTNMKVFFRFFVIDIILASPISIAHALLSSDVVWSVAYFVIGLLTNWVFGLSQMLIYEDRELSLVSALIWSASAAFNPTYFTMMIVTVAFIYVCNMIVVFSPMFLILWQIVFFEIFGFSSPSEVHFTNE